MARDDFSEKTKRHLREAAGFNCVRPGCGKPVMAFDPALGKMINISISAHDSAAAPGGPRYDGDFTPEQRKAIENGAFLCANDARLVDADKDRFPPGTISGWQQKAAENRLMGQRMPNPPTGIDFSQACAAAQRFLLRCNDIQFNRWNNSISWRSVDAIGNLLLVTHPLTATNQFCALFPHMVNIQIQMLEAIRLVKSEISNRDCWFYDENGKVFIPNLKSLYCSNENEQTRNNRIDQSVVLVEERFQDFRNLSNDLSEIAYASYPPMDLYSW